MRIACLAAALALALGGGEALAQSAGVASANQPDPAAAAASPEILVSGVPATAPDVQKIIDTEYQQAMAAAGHPATLGHAPLQAVTDRITAALKKAGYPDAHAYLADEVATFHAHDVNAATASTAAVGATSSAAPVAAVAAGAAAAVASSDTAPAPTPAPPAPLADNVVPPLKDREVGTAPTQQIAVGGFHVIGVNDHAKAGITPASIQAMADTQYQQLGGKSGQPAKLTFDQLQGVADKITARYRKAGFIVATAFLPAQTVGSDQIIQIQVLEGQIGKIIVKGTKRYYPGVIAAPAEKLRGKALQKSDVDTALLYDRDLPGVSVASTFQPGAKTGDTDLIMVAREAPRPYTITVGADNYGTDLTGKYRAQVGVTWNSPLGIGDSLAANVDYALDPSQNVYGSLIYSAPLVVEPGLSAVVGATRSELQINTGQFAALDVRGPSSTYFGGMDWKFVNDEDLKLLGSLHFIREQAKLNSNSMMLSDEIFNVADLGFALNQTDREFHGVNLLQVDVRKSISDDSREPDLVSPDHARSFLSTRVSYTRLQFLTDTQRLYFKINGQYSRDVLAPLEQFAIGGPDSVRAYPIADALMDRGYYSALEYHIDAPGFANVISPFYGRPWRELLELETFVDYARGYPVSADQTSTNKMVTYSGVGAGFIFRLPRFHQFEFHLDGSVPLGSQEASDKNGYHVYARVGLTF
ncbi:MAG: ShlB/FhaC/HecB family hemolysin secretion/activation protein [Rhodanobacter sp.]